MGQGMMSQANERQDENKNFNVSGNTNKLFQLSDFTALKHPCKIKYILPSSTNTKIFDGISCNKGISEKIIKILKSSDTQSQRKLKEAYYVSKHKAESRNSQYKNSRNTSNYYQDRKFSKLKPNTFQNLN